MVKRKGASTLIAVFIILVISLIAVSWFRASSTTGSGLQQQIVQQATIDNFNHRFRSTELYLREGLALSAQKGSRKSANHSGRVWDDQEARYWYCKGSNQTPSVDTARNSTAEFTSEFFEGRLNEAHGIRENTIYNVGGPLCVEQGYNKPLKNPGNKEFKVGGKISSLNLSSQQNSLSRTERKLPLKTEANLNRYWYLYSVLKDWVEEENLKNRVREEMKEVPDVKSAVTSACGSSPDACSYAPTYTCKETTGRKLEEKVKEGLNREMEKLEENSNYFNGNNVTCEYYFNEFETNQNRKDYPGFSLGKGVNTEAVPQEPPMTCKNNGMKTVTVDPDCYNVTEPGACKEYGTREERAGCKEYGTKTSETCSYDQSKGKEVCTEHETQYCKEFKTKEVSYCKERKTKKVEVCPSSYEEEVCTTEMVEDPPECGTSYKCITRWHLSYKAYLDFTVACTDEKYKSIPSEDMEKQRWKIDLSYQVQENHVSGQPISCNERVGSTKSYAPTSLKSCQFTRTASTCQAPGEVTN